MSYGVVYTQVHYTALNTVTHDLGSGAGLTGFVLASVDELHCTTGGAIWSDIRF